MNKIEKLIKALRGNDKKIAAFLQMSDEKACRMFALGVAVFLSAVLSIGVLDLFGSTPIAAFASTASLAMMGPLSIVCCNRYLRVSAKNASGILPIKQVLILDFHEEVRLINELKLSRKDTLLLRKKAFEELKIKKEQLAIRHIE